MDSYGEVFLLNRDRKPIVNGYARVWTYDYVYESMGGTTYTTAPSALGNGWGGMWPEWAPLSVSGPTAITDHFTFNGHQYHLLTTMNVVAGLRNSAFSDAGPVRLELRHLSPVLPVQTSDYRRNLILRRTRISPYDVTIFNTLRGLDHRRPRRDCVDVVLATTLATLAATCTDVDRAFTVQATEIGQHGLHEQTQYRKFFKRTALRTAAGTVRVAGFGAKPNCARRVFNDVPGESRKRATPGAHERWDITK